MPPVGKDSHFNIRSLSDQTFCACAVIREVFGISARLHLSAETPQKVVDVPKGDRKCYAKASRGFEPRSLDSESRVLTVTPRGQIFEVSLS